MTAKSMHILWLSVREDLWKEIKGFADAFQRCGAQIVFVEPGTPQNVDIQELIAKCGERPKLIVHPEPYWPILPRGLAEVDIPTVGFQTDVYAYTRRRFLVSMLFDYTVLLHPGFEEAFRAAGHPAPMTLPLAVDPGEFYDSNEERVFEIASVGRTNPLYKTRQAVLSELSREFKMNDWSRRYEPEEVPPVYRASKIVVNIPRDDYLIDVSMRYAEAMASGALFLTRVPSEMTALGFEEGVHYCGYRDPREIPGIARKYLNDEALRFRIAQAGREKTLREHTYDAGVARLLERLEEDNGELLAPARAWTASQVSLAYLDYFASNRLFDCAGEELRGLMRRASPDTLRALKIYGRARASWIRNWIRQQVSSSKR